MTALEQYLADENNNLRKKNNQLIQELAHANYTIRKNGLYFADQKYNRQIKKSKIIYHNFLNGIYNKIPASK